MPISSSSSPSWKGVVLNARGSSRKTWRQICNIATLHLQVLPACHTTSSLSASLTCSWHLLVFSATNQPTWLRHKRSSECSLEAHEQITQNRQDMLLHTEGPNELNIPTDANWILVANKAHHPKQTEQIPARQGSKYTESATSLKLLTVSLFLPSKTQENNGQFCTKTESIPSERH
jgi:hypothetical protein